LPTGSLILFLAFSSIIIIIVEMSDPVQLRILVAGGFALNTKITQSSAFISVDNIYDTINT
jgi:hypothetical protein